MIYLFALFHLHEISIAHPLSKRWDFSGEVKRVDFKSAIY